MKNSRRMISWKILYLILTVWGIQSTQADHKFVHPFPSPHSTENYLSSERVNRGGVVAEMWKCGHDKRSISTTDCFSNFNDYKGDSGKLLRYKSQVQLFIMGFRWFFSGPWEPTLLTRILGESNTNGLGWFFDQ